MRPIRYAHRTVALCASDDVLFAPEIAAVEPDHPTRRFVSMQRARPHLDEPISVGQRAAQDVKDMAHASFVAGMDSVLGPGERELPWMGDAPGAPRTVRWGVPTRDYWRRRMEAHADELGPIDIAVIAYPADAPMTGEAAPLLVDLVERGIIRVLDVMFVTKNEDGTFSGFEARDLTEKGVGDFEVFEGALLRPAG
jgi:hypothetical protein